MPLRHRVMVEIFLVVGLAAGLAEAFSRDEAGVLLRENFDTDPDSGLAADLLRRQEIDLAVGQGPDGSDAIRVSYIGYERGSRRVTHVHRLPGAFASATLAFDVRFAKDFQFVKGGKLHGLGPRKSVTGGQDRRPDGWSARLHFRTGGCLASYWYDQDPDLKYGRVEDAKGPVFSAGRWHRVEYRVRLNDPGQANGWTRITVDGSEILRSEGIAFRGVGGEASLIQTFLFATFHGGQDPDWAPVDAAGRPTTVHAWFDNFVVFEGTGEVPGS